LKVTSTLAALLFAVTTSGICAPFVPSEDGFVLERLPVRATDPLVAELRGLREAARANPADPAAAARLARRYFDLASAEGDPRYVGYAEAALQRWPEAAGTPAEILVLRGMLRQYRHDFPRGLADFQLALQADPASTEARAWRAAIFMVQADYAGARRECGLLAPHATELQATACLAYVDATTGHARAAYDRLRAALARRADVAPDFELWIQTRLAEMAWRSGDVAVAERHFRRGLALGVDDNFLLAAYADFLMERGRAAEVIPLLKNWARSDTLLLRLALAAHRLGLQEAARHARALGERFADAALRGEKLHLQEEARYLLELKGDPRAALAAAAENYRTQKEPRDALVLIDAALAAREPGAAAAALQWLDETGYEDPRLRAAAARLKALKP
jgi:Tfp pilus assembly protein PilF